jgi:serine/threonine protein phosphatase 1
MPIPQQPAPRTIAIGDIHGCADALAGLLVAIAPTPNDRIITLGDYIDRGDNSKGVLEQLLELSKQHQIISLRGNHEEMLLDAFQDQAGHEFWMNCGGMTTLGSYGSAGEIGVIPKEHIDFVRRLRLYYETDTHLFIHANYDPNLPLEKQDPRILLWRTLDHIPGPHYSGKIAIVGHTPQLSHRILDLGYLKCLDTGCGEEGLLTALDLGSGQTWQVDERGNVVLLDEMP